MVEQSDYYTVESEKVREVSALTGLSFNAVRNIMLDDWSNREGHQEWLEKATPGEIASWIKSTIE